jgi:hypothetical protein
MRLPASECGPDAKLFEPKGGRRRAAGGVRVTNYYSAGRYHRSRGENRQFAIIMGATCGLLVLSLVGFVWLAIATEPRRHAEYLADCQAKGFAAEQCQFLYADGPRRAADDADAIALGAAARAVAAGRQ